MPRRLFAGILFTFVMIGLPTGAYSQALTLDQTIAEALASNLEVKGERSNEEAAQATLEGAQARYLPILRVEGNAIVWDEEQTLALGGSGGGGQLPAPTTPYEGAVAGLLAQLGEPITVRDRVTATARVSVIQPLTQLYAVDNLVSVEEGNVAVAKAQREVKETQIVKMTSTTYLQALLAERLIQNVETSLEELSAQRGRVESLVEADLAVPADLMRIDVAVADRRRELIRLENSRELAISQLGLLMNRPADAAITLQSLGDGATAPPGAPGTLKGQIDKALSTRSEMKMLSARKTQSEHGVALAQSQYIPDLNLIGTYEHNQGSALALENQFFAGLFLEWNAFEWGASSSQVSAARARKHQVDAVEEQARRGIALEVKSAWLSMESARKSWDVANQAVAQSETVFKAEQARVAQQSATATDLVSAQSALTTARNARSAAWYGALVAYVDLQIATGVTPTLASLGLGSP